MSQDKALHRTGTKRKESYPMRDTTLVIMAAGIGSRYKDGVKQLAHVGPAGEIIMDYSIHDALEAGFNKVIFIIRRDLRDQFREIIGSRIEKLTKVEYAYQELDCLPEGYEVPAGRVKPWGTGHALLMIKGMVHEPFLVINADDYYGREGFKKIHDYMVNDMDLSPGFYDMCMAGFTLDNTLSDHGVVTRGVCQLNDDGTLKRVTETYGIRKENGKIVATDRRGNPVKVEAGQPVSMNMWGLPPAFLDELEKAFPKFLDGIEEGDLTAEYLLPAIIDNLIQKGKARVTVLESDDKWYGVTYKEDKKVVADAIHELTDEGVYKENLYD